MHSPIAPLARLAVLHPVEVHLKTANARMHPLTIGLAVLDRSCCICRHLTQDRQVRGTAVLNRLAVLIARTVR